MSIDQSAPHHRPRKRVSIPLALLGMIVVFLVIAIVRGTWADTTPRNPASSAEGPVTRLYQSPDGHKQVRTAMLFDYPVEEVWNTITDYAHYTEVFPFLSNVTAEKTPDQMQHIRATTHSALGDWTFDVLAKHTVMPESSTSQWDQPGGDLSVNRGSWTLTPAGPGKTLAAYSLEIEINRVPTFAIRNVLLSKQQVGILAVAERLKKTHPK